MKTQGDKIYIGVRGSNSLFYIVENRKSSRGETGLLLPGEQFGYCLQEHFIAKKLTASLPMT